MTGRIITHEKKIRLIEDQHLLKVADKTTTFINLRRMLVLSFKECRDYSQQAKIMDRLDIALSEMTKAVDAYNDWRKKHL